MKKIRKPVTDWRQQREWKLKVRPGEKWYQIQRLHPVAQPGPARKKATT